MTNVRDNKALSRFELDIDKGVAFASYRRTASAVIITHTETPRAMRGRGVASELVDGALQLIRVPGSKVVAGCGFVVDYLEKHPEFADLVGDPVRQSGWTCRAAPPACTTAHHPSPRGPHSPASRNK